MDTAQLRLCFLDVLRNLNTNRVDQFNSLIPEVARYAAQRGFIPKQERGREKLPPGDEEKVRELFWSLIIIQGVLMPGHDGMNPNVPFFSLTEYGREVVNSEDPVPHDPDQYLIHLKGLAPELDQVAVSYVAEGLECFQRGTYTASMVMLGVASEKLILDLANAVHKALLGKEAENLLREIQRGKIARIYEETMKRLTPRMPRLPNPLNDGLGAHIDGVFTTIRTHRNQAGHPSGQMIDRLTALGLYSSFPFYCKRVSELIEHIKTSGLPK